VSRSTTAAAPFFPTDEALQARAVALAPTNGIDPYYQPSAGSRSFGRSLSAAWERQLSPRLFVGARVELERSPYYTPNRYLLYFRLATDASAARPVVLAPDPVLPTSQY
jgi:hypothetical protein